MAENKNDDKALCHEIDDVRSKSIKILKRAIICLENPDCKLCPLADSKECECDTDEDFVSAYVVAIHDMEERIKNENENI